jgi:hypothetical protein
MSLFPCGPLLLAMHHEACAAMAFLSASRELLLQHQTIMIEGHGFVEVLVCSLQYLELTRSIIHTNNMQ